jgi:hypothetical protein
VSEWAREQAADYPRLSHLDFFSMAPQKLIGRFSILVRSFAVSTAEVPTVKPTARARVTDDRIQTATGPLTYVTTNRFIQPGSKTAYKLVANFNRRVSEVNNSHGHPGRSGRPFMYVILGLGVLVPLILWKAKKLTKQQ